MTGTTQLTAFGHLQIEFDERVLRPRTWTELQSAWSADLLRDVPPGDVLEVCSGAGHIGLLAISGTDRHLVQVDADEIACTFARTNAARARTSGTRWSVEVRHGWLEGALAPEERFALVIADPPWVPSADTGAHPDDPLSAIDGGPDGLECTRSCLAVIGRHLAPQGAAVLQVGDAEQVEQVRTYVEQRPDLDLVAVDHRVLDDGALVRLARRS